MKYLKPPLNEMLPVAWIRQAFLELSYRNTDLVFMKFGIYENNHFDRMKKFKFVKFPIIFQLALTYLSFYT